LFYFSSHFLPMKKFFFMILPLIKKEHNNRSWWSNPFLAPPTPK